MKPKVRRGAERASWISLMMHIEPSSLTSWMQFTVVANPPCQARKPWRASAWSRQCSLAGRVYSVDRSNDLRARDIVDANADLRFNKKAGNRPILIIARIGDAVAFRNIGRQPSGVKGMAPQFAANCACLPAGRPTSGTQTHAKLPQSRGKLIFTRPRSMAAFDPGCVKTQAAGQGR